MNISMINVSLMDSLKKDIMDMARDAGVDIDFEDVLGYRPNVLINSSLAADAFGASKVQAKVARLKNSYLVHDIASGIINDDHKTIRENGMRVARDLIKYSEQDIEKVVRCGIEVANASTALVVGEANILMTSRVWQRIASEVATDYNCQVDYVDFDEFILGFNLYIEKYPLILMDSLFGSIAGEFLTRLREVKCTFFVGENDAFYLTDGSTNETALAIYEIIKEKDPVFATGIKEYFDNYAK